MLINIGIMDSISYIVIIFAVSAASRVLVYVTIVVITVITENVKYIFI